MQPPPKPPYVGFKDLHGFKDYIGSVILCLPPNKFPVRSYLRPEAQLTFERAFQGLRYGIDLLEAERGMPETAAQCRWQVDQAHDLYARGDWRSGLKVLQQLDAELAKIHTR